MGFYLLDHPNPHGDHFYRSRRGSVLAIVVHITAGLEDLDATADQSAEATARYAATTDRSVSWHSGSDSDSALDLLPASYTAFHVQGYNSRTYGHEISKRDTDWRDEPEPWRTRTLRNAAVHLAAKARELGVPLRKATRAEVDRALVDGRPVGFVSHWELDEDRRSDPGLVRGVGDTFPWTEFFAIATNQEDDVPDIQEIRAAVEAELNEFALRRYDEGAFMLREALGRNGAGLKHIERQNAAQAAQLAALTEAVAQLGAGGTIDYGRIEQAAENAVRTVLADAATP